LLLTASVVAQSVASVEVSERLRIPDAQTLLLTAKGVGVQIYKSQLKSGSTTEFEWVLKEPRASLYDNSRQKIGKHYAGPTWESKDGSKVVGKLKQSVPAPKADNIPWLLVEAQSHESKGIFSSCSGDLVHFGGQRVSGVQPFSLGRRGVSWPIVLHPIAPRVVTTTKERLKAVVPATVPLTAIGGIGEARARRLAGIGLDSIEKLADAAPEDVAKALEGVSVEKAAEFIERAKQLLASAKKP
jgi:hypothetical protein